MSWNSIPLADCTLQTCPLQSPNGTVLANTTYDPSLGGNAFYMSLFILALLFQVALGIRYKTWGYTIALVLGLILEICGYGGRIGQHFNPFDSNSFMLYLVTITIAPAFICAGIYLTLARLIVVYYSISPSDPKAQVARFSPRIYTITFITCDFLCLLLQAIGGAMASISTINSPGQQTGINIMIAGVSLQVFSLAVFSVLSLDFTYRVHRTPSEGFNTAFTGLRRTTMFRGFCCALAVAVVTIFTRSVFRVAELSGGFNGPLANQQVTFMVLEGAMMSIAVIALTVFHPGVAFGGHWGDAMWSLRGGKNGVGMVALGEKVGSGNSSEEMLAS